MSVENDGNWWHMTRLYPLLSSITRKIKPYYVNTLFYLNKYNMNKNIRYTNILNKSFQIIKKKFTIGHRSRQMIKNPKVHIYTKILLTAVFEYTWQVYLKWMYRLTWYCEDYLYQSIKQHVHRKKNNKNDVNHR